MAVALGSNLSIIFFYYKVAFRGVELPRVGQRCVRVNKTNYNYYENLELDLEGDNLAHGWLFNVY